MTEKRGIVVCRNFGLLGGAVPLGENLVESGRKWGIRSPVMP